MTNDELDRLYKENKMPAWIYYQQTNKPMQAYSDQKKMFYEYSLKRDEEKQLHIQLEKQVIDILTDILKDFHF